MKITLITPALVAVLGLVLSSLPSNAQTNVPPVTTPTPATSTPVKKPAATAKPVQYSGKITAISATSVTVQGKESLTLAIDAKTKFKKDDKKATAADFAVGDAVTGSYTTDATGAMTAHSLHKKTAAK